MEWASKFFGTGVLPEDLERALSAQQRQRMGSGALMDAGIAMLANSGYSTTPQTLGQIVGQGLGAGRQSVAAQGQLQQEAMQRQQAEMAQRQQAQQYEAMLAQMPPEMAAAYRLLAPQEGAKALAGQRGREGLKRLEAELKQPTLTPLQREAAQLFPDDPGAQAAWIKQQRDKPTGTQLTVNTGQQDTNWGQPPKDSVWARDERGQVVTERDPATGAMRPIVLPIKGSQGDVEAAANKAKAADAALRGHQTITGMLEHPGLDTAVGLSGQLDPRNYVWGSEAQGALSYIKQVQGQAFLQAFESLKGAGQITQVEGEKATQAIGRLERAQSEKDFKAAAKELQGILARAYERSTGQPIPSAAQDDDDALINKYLGQ